MNDLRFPVSNTFKFLFLEFRYLIIVINLSGPLDNFGDCKSYPSVSLWNEPTKKSFSDKPNSLYSFDLFLFQTKCFDLSKKESL